jgi:hypothetical protein
VAPRSIPAVRSAHLPAGTFQGSSILAQPYMITLRNHISSFFIIYHHISPYIIIDHHFSSFFIIYHHISSYIWTSHSIAYSGPAFFRHGCCSRCPIGPTQPGKRETRSVGWSPSHGTFPWWANGYNSQIQHGHHFWWSLCSNNLYMNLGKPFQSLLVTIWA